MSLHALSFLLSLTPGLFLLIFRPGGLFVFGGHVRRLHVGGPCTQHLCCDQDLTLCMFRLFDVLHMLCLFHTLHGLMRIIGSCMLSLFVAWVHECAHM